MPHRGTGSGDKDRPVTPAGPTVMSDEHSQTGKKHVNRVQLRPLLGKDFPDSRAFIAEFGKLITQHGMFIPTGQVFEPGQELELRFTLRDEKEIVAGTARVISYRDGSNGEVPGCKIRFVDLTDRSRKNLEMIAAWRGGT